ncbi:MULTISPECIES: hypothetical protein [unclassified Agarivorans]|uniref:hypothetical protein n=1 Tax=unclassified Agarivorans TaxID=2636026 RepID=UPI0026E3BDED|nr:MULTISPECIES: hypothetical protein [unclassified Agarivorans]MDO6686415.1 hypothetical protein [Agarivorans sp. 3_MG-2023]MDO6713717.1 hypothetical protein [Agarivorans sp. 2_MG-2023]
MTRLVTKDTLANHKVKGITGYAKGPNIILIKHLALSLLILGLTACFGSLTEIKLKVIDQDGQAVKNAEVSMSFLLGKGSNKFKGTTDEKGEATALRVGQFGVIVRINKEGYYQSKTRTGGSGNRNLTMELRKKKNPTAMYAKKLLLPFPKKREAIGFDFEQADWVSPYGKGNTAHIFFYLDGEYIDVHNNNDELQISFANADDGLVKLNKATTNSEYLFPYLAPQLGYTNILTLKHQTSSNSKSFTTYDNSALGYIFRINTKLNSEGEVVHANYGKISGEFLGSSYTGTTKRKNVGFVKFTYYYNPTPNDRSLEYDWRQNLFIDLKLNETIREP